MSYTVIDIDGGSHLHLTLARVKDPSRRSRAQRACLLGFATLCACSSAAPPGASLETPTTPNAALLLDVWSQREAQLVAVIKEREWLVPGAVDAAFLKQVARPGTAYVLLPSSTAEPPTAAGSGELSGALHEDCLEFRLELARPSAALAFGVVNTARPVRPVPLETVLPEPQHVAVVASILQKVGGIQITPTIKHAYRADLDSDGKPELILEATHPDLAGDPPEYKPEYHSLLVVLDNDASLEPVFAGYIQAATDLSTFHVLALDAVADVDLDGTPELLVRTRHNEGFSTQVFHYQRGAALTKFFYSGGGERECPEPGAEH